MTIGICGIFILSYNVKIDIIMPIEILGWGVPQCKKQFLFEAPFFEEMYLCLFFNNLRFVSC